MQKALDALADAELVERLPRRPGQSQDRYVQLLGGEAPAETVLVPTPSEPAPPGLEERVARLEEQVYELQRRFEER